ncbi:putative Autophagy-related protein 22-1 [Glarea lozoyensis 74030]|uniref:Autophagy-related protein n=1 Tax=Glarea lozoyensis (strain ATCC 74030 / MF5533) TaxID=1104152 RepID=H0EEL9_GLAL7|nr:putative Autophagy-related protein 22-1 [Glarea lozoyensis 74030]
MGTVAIALLSITATSSGILGAFVWPLISRRYELPTQKLIIACVCAMEIIPLYGLLGFIPFVKHWGVGGLQKSWEIYPLGIVHGFVMGGLSSYCRAFYGRLIPEGKEAAFYALYAVTDKGSSAVGPAIVGMIVDRTGTIRVRGKSAPKNSMIDTPVHGPRIAVRRMIEGPEVHDPSEDWSGKSSTIERRKLQNRLAQSEIPHV